VLRERSNEQDRHSSRNQPLRQYLRDTKRGALSAN
jgi:hypothetical protein